VVSSLAPHVPGLHSGWYFFKEWIIWLLVALSATAWGLALARGRVTMRWHRVALIPVLLLAWSAVSLVLSASPATALIGTHKGEAGWLAFLSCVLGGFLTLQLTDRTSRVRDLARAVAFGAGVVAAYGLLQTLDLDWVTYDVRWGAFRSFGTLGNPDMFGTFMALTLPVAAALVLSETDKPWKAAAGIAFVLIGTAAFTSLTRAAWLGAGIGTITLVLLLRPLKPKIGRYEVLLIGALALSIAVFAIASLNAENPDSNVGARIASAGDLSSRNTAGRLEVWRIAGTAIADRPIAGWGPDTFHLAFETNRTETLSGILDPHTTMASAHDWVLQTAAETGIPGLAMLVRFLAAVALVSARWIRGAPATRARHRVLFAGGWAACSGYLAASLFTPGSPPARLLLWCLLGVLLSPLAARAESPRALSRRAVSWAAIALGVSLTVLALAAVYADAQAAVGADERGAPEARTAAADAAMAVNPLSAEYAIVAMNAHANRVPMTGAPMQGGRHAEFDKALAAAERAVELEPANPYRKAALVAILIVGGQDVDPQYAQTAAATGEAAVKSAPNHLDLAYQYARALVEVGREADAVAVLRRALDVRTGFGTAAVLLSELYAENGDLDAAKAVLRESLAQVKDADVQARLDALEAPSR